jgi:hypothetical protein
MKKLFLAVAIIVFIATLSLLAVSPVPDYRECRDPGVYQWQYDRDVCIPQPK